MPNGNDNTGNNNDNNPLEAVCLAPQGTAGLAPLLLPWRSHFLHTLTAA